MKLNGFYVKKITTLADGSFKLELVTQELDDETALALIKNRNKFIDEVVEVPAIEEDAGKSPSQRLRGVIYRLWEQNGKEGGSFEIYYRMVMELLIEKYKEKLN